ncbi:MAG: hypothetical protein HGA53_11145, partial [Anaerolineaceae bacterium]|nr:hypothetical protein [Anaerolineaceae bacterium]
MTDAVNTNRADQLRQRRAQDSQERARASAQRVTTPLRSKPVTQRRDTAPRSSQNFRTIPVAQKSRSKPRRQFYYTLSGTGAEVRLPAIPMVKLGPR